MLMSQVIKVANRNPQFRKALIKELKKEAAYGQSLVDSMTRVLKSLMKEIEKPNPNPRVLDKLKKDYMKITQDIYLIVGWGSDQRPERPITSNLTVWE